MKIKEYNEMIKHITRPGTPEENKRLEEQHKKFEIDRKNNKRKEFDIRRGGRTEIPVVDLLLKTHTLNGSLSGIDIKNWNFELGINGFFQDNFSTPDTGVKRLIPDYIKFETGVYFLGNFQRSYLFLWEWGLRLDHVSYDSKKYYYKSNWNERNYNILFQGFETGQDFANQILTNPKFNYFNSNDYEGKTHYNIHENWIKQTTSFITIRYND
mgnify:CR=1 FL=1